jgi:hypothetical protein
MYLGTESEGGQQGVAGRQQLIDDPDHHARYTCVARRGGTMSTTTDGDRFRDQVADLLKAAGYISTAEILEDHKRIDVVFELMAFGKRRRYAVEAKNWQRPLNHSDLEGIFAGYASFVLKRQIDELLIVSPHELRSPAAKAYSRGNVAGLSANYARTYY